MQGDIRGTIQADTSNGNLGTVTLGPFARLRRRGRLIGLSVSTREKDNYERKL